MLLIAFTVLVFDQASKLAISSLLTLHESLPVISGIVHFTLVHNTGAVFGIFQGANFILTAASAAFLLLLSLLYYKLHNSSAVLRTAFGLAAGGAAGNLADRARLGYVIDFIDLGFWPVFNIADIALTSGAVLFIWKVFMQGKAA